MPEEGNSLQAVSVARAHGAAPRLEEDDGLRGAPATASVTQLKGMVPKPELPVSLEAMFPCRISPVASGAPARASGC